MIHNCSLGKLKEYFVLVYQSERTIYEVALPLIKEWLNSDCTNVRRTASEKTFC